MNEADFGTQTAVIGDEHELAYISDVSTYVLAVDLTEMAPGDATTLKVYTQVIGTSSSVLLATQSFVGAQAVPAFQSIPIPTVHGVTFAIQQTAGVGRDYPWSVIALA